MNDMKIKDMKDFYENLTDVEKTKFLKTRLSSLNGILAHHQQLATDVSSEMEEVQLKIDKMTCMDEVCGLDYYGIRSGECKYGDTYGRGDLACSNPHCKHYNKFV